MSDKKVSEMTANSTPQSTDLLMLIDDPSGSPQNQKITVADLLGTVSVKNYGAVGDGVTDDTDAFTAAFAAFDSVYAPEGNYLISSALTLADNQKLTGAGWRNTIITLSGVATRINLSDWNTITDLRVVGADTNTFGISATATASRWELRRVWISNCATGLGLNNTWIGSVNDCLIRDCTNGIFCHDGLSSNGPVNAINISGGELAACTYGIRFGLNGGSAFQVRSFTVTGEMAIETSSTYGIWVEDVSIHTLNLIELHFEACGDAIYRQDVGINSLLVSGCQCQLDDASGDKGFDITGGVTQVVKWESNEFNRGSGSSATEAIDLGSGATIINSILDSNVWAHASLVYVNDAGAFTHAFGDELLGTLLYRPNIRDNRENVTTTNVITAAETGSTFYLNSAGGFTSTLPAPEHGLNYKFIVKTAPTTAYIVTTNSGADVLYGTVIDIVGELVYFSTMDQVNFAASTSVVGDRLEVESDGTNWYCKAISGADGGITVTVT